MTTTIVYTPLHEMELDVARFSAFIVLTWMPWWRMCKRHPDVCRGSVLPKGATCTERWKMFLVFTSQLFLFRSYILSFAWRLARHADRSYDVCFGGDVCQCHDVVILQGKQNFSYNYHMEACREFVLVNPLHLTSTGHIGSCCYPTARSFML